MRPGCQWKKENKQKKKYVKPSSKNPVAAENEHKIPQKRKKNQTGS